jgi:hypothetical protein
MCHRLLTTSYHKHQQSRSLLASSSRLDPLSGGERQSGVGTDVPRAGGNLKRVDSALESPLLGYDVPMTEIPSEHAESDLCATTGWDADLFEPTEDAHRHARRRGVANVPLGDLGAVDGARVFDSRRDGDHLVPQIGDATETHGARRVLRRQGSGVGLGDRCCAVRVGRVTQPVAEGVARRDALDVEPTIIDVHAFGERAVISCAGEGWVVGRVLRDGVGELGVRVDITVENI